MNRFLTFTGVQPVFLGDVDFMQDAAANGFKQLARALMGSGDEAMNAILQGVKITSAAGNLYSWTAGVVVLNGELLPIAAGSVNAIDRDHLYFHVVSTLSGERTFEDQETHECYDTRTATINAVSEGGVQVSSIPRLFHQPEDVEIISDVATVGLIRNGKIRRKNGFWFIEMTFDLSEGANVIEGVLRFREDEGITQEMFDSMEEVSFPCLIRVEDESAYAQATCVIAKDAENLTISATIKEATSVTVAAASGIGRLKTMIIPA